MALSTGSKVPKLISFLSSKNNRFLFWLSALVILQLAAVIVAAKSDGRRVISEDPQRQNQNGLEIYKYLPNAVVAQWLALATRDRKVASSIPDRGIPRNNLG